MKFAKRILLGLALVFLAAQFFQPARSNPPVAAGRDLIAVTAPPPPVAVLLRAACYDCHSHETIWPWYSRISPVSWWVADHVKDGRKHLNFSDWPPADARRAKKKLGHIAETVTEGEMPLPSYTWIHAQARLSVADKKLIADWAEAEAAKISAAPEREKDDK